MSAAITVFPARRVITMEPDSPDATAVAVSGDRMVAVGSLAELRDADNLGGPVGRRDIRRCDRLSRLYRPAPSSGIGRHHVGHRGHRTRRVGPERPHVPGGGFGRRVSTGVAERRARTHRSAKLAVLMGLSPAMARPPRPRGARRHRPSALWHRSCHEWFLNSAAIEELDIGREHTADDRASTMVDLDDGHWWEAGLNLLLPKLAPVFMSAERMTVGLRRLVGYLHSTGVTAFNEPGIMWHLEPRELYQQILGAEGTPFLSTFLVDARSQTDAGMDAADAVTDAEAQVARAATRKVRLLPKHVKLFADGAMISQLMQMKDPYLDDAGRPDPHHHGEWMMQPNTFRAFAKVYWDAGWQLHIHVNGDAGLQLVLDTIEQCMEAHPRADHRTVIVHFANSTEEQIDRIARLGAIVSANPYYPVGFADKYSRHGLGPDRAATMVRSASVLKRGIPLSLHSDLPMAPADPLALAWCAVNRRTPSGRIALPRATHLSARRLASDHDRGGIFVADGTRVRQHRRRQAGKLHRFARGPVHR
jgi:predicted amidohydrolase YtcJ